MLVRFLCPACHQLLGIAPRKVGAQVNCPKCGATILVPDPEEPRSSEAADQSAPGEGAAADPALDFTGDDFTAPDYTGPDYTAPEITASDILPPNASSFEPPSAVGAVGSDVLGDVRTFERPIQRVAPTPSAPKHLPPSAELPLDDGERIVISRRVLYFQAVLLAVVGILALVAGYLIGSGAGRGP